MPHMTDGTEQAVPESARYDYGGACWWCGSAAGSREHKFPRAEVVRSFGAGPYRGDLVRVEGDGQRFIQGPNSSELKFPANLCASCNNARSQRFDRAYDKFSEYMFDSGVRHESLRVIRLDQLFGSAWRDAGHELAAYDLKHLGCRLARDGVRVPDGVVNFLDRSTDRLTAVEMDFHFRRDYFEIAQHSLKAHGERLMGLFMTPADCQFAPESNSITDVRVGITTGLFQMDYHVHDLDRPHRHPFSRRRVRYNTRWIVPPEVARFPVRSAIRPSNPKRDGLSGCRVVGLRRCRTRLWRGSDRLRSRLRGCNWTSISRYARRHAPTY